MRQRQHMLEQSATHWTLTTLQLDHGRATARGDATLQLAAVADIPAGWHALPIRCLHAVHPCDNVPPHCVTARKHSSATVANDPGHTC